MLQPPTAVFIELDLKIGAWFLAWLTPSFDGAFCSIWCHPTMRGSRQLVASSLKVWEMGLEEYPVLVGITKQPKLLDEHYRLGYTEVGVLPAFWGGEDATII